MILQKKQIIAQIYILLAGILFGSVGFLTTKVINADIPISNALFWRFFIASFVLVPFLFKKSEIELNRRNITITLLTGVLLNGPSILFYFIATRIIGIGLATTIAFCFPITVAFVAWITKSELLSKHTLIALSLIVVGLLFLYDNSKTLHIFGILFAVFASITYGICIFANKRYSIETCTYNSTFMLCFGSAAFFLGISLLSREFFIPNDIYFWINTVIVGVVCTVLPFFFLLKAMKDIPVIHASILLIIEPLFSILLGVVGLNEEFNLKQSVAIAIILSGIIIQQLKARKA